MEKYKIIALLGQSGSGKDAVLDAVSYLAPKQVNKIIQATTRPKREKEKNGEDYWFLSDLDFKTKINDKEIIGWTCFNNWYYGTPIGSLSAEKPNIGVFNPEAIQKLQEYENIELTIFEIYASDKERLLRQLNRENNPNVTEIIRRYMADKEDFNNLKDIKCNHLVNETQKDLITNIGIIKDYFE